MKKKSGLFGIIICFTFCVNAQDPHFSQFFSSPLTLNPALTGKFDGTLRVAGNYRNQWPAFNNVYTTSTLSVDFGILKNKLPDFDTWGVGILALTDKAGGGVLTNNYIGLSTSYHKALDEDGYQQLGIGFQGTYGQKRLDNSKLVFEDQLTPFGFTGVTQDIFSSANLNINYFDVNAGLLYSGSTSDRNNYYVGASMYHINRPKESFKGGNWNIATRTTISAGGYFPVSDILTLHTSGIYQVQNKSSAQPQLMADAPFSFQFHGLAAISLFALWPFTRLVHVFTAPLGYIFRPYILYRSRDAHEGSRARRRGWDKVDTIPRRR